MKQDVIVIGEHSEGKVKPVTYEVLTFALKLVHWSKGDLKAIFLGDDVESVSHELWKRHGIDVLGIEVPGLTLYNGEVYKNILGSLLTEKRPGYICAAHSSQGGDFAPGLAVSLNAACITSVEGVFQDKGRIYFSRSMYGGKITAEVESTTEVTVLTVQPGIFKSGKLSKEPPGSVQMETLPFPSCQSESLGVKRSAAEDAELTSAHVVVSAGRGIGKRENLDLIYRLAALFPKSAVGGSRPICDTGWLPYKRQVGLTGATVAPRLYIACGISGAVQHVTGIRDAGFIVAINADPQAAIFNMADICIVEDLMTFIPLLLDAYQSRETRVPH